MIEISEMADVSLSHALFYMREREREFWEDFIFAR